jgi:hypothetical protein
LADGHFVSFEGIDAGSGEFGEEFSSGDAGACRADALTVSAHSFPVAFVFVVGVPETVHAVEFAGFGIAFGGLTPEDAFKLCFVVFSACCGVHGSTIPAKFAEGKVLIQNLSKMENPGGKFQYNYVIMMELFCQEVMKRDGESKNRAKYVII